MLAAPVSRRRYPINFSEVFSLKAKRLLRLRSEIQRCRQRYRVPHREECPRIVQWRPLSSPGINASYLSGLFLRGSAVLMIQADSDTPFRTFDLCALPENLAPFSPRICPNQRVPKACRRWRFSRRYSDCIPHFQLVTSTNIFESGDQVTSHWSWLYRCLVPK